MLVVKKTFCGFSMGRNQYWAERVYDFVCLLYDVNSRRKKKKKKKYYVFVYVYDFPVREIDKIGLSFEIATFKDYG